MIVRRTLIVICMAFVCLGTLVGCTESPAGGDYIGQTTLTSDMPEDACCTTTPPSCCTTLPPAIIPDLGEALPSTTTVGSDIPAFGE